MCTTYHVAPTSRCMTYASPWPLPSSFPSSPSSFSPFSLSPNFLSSPSIHRESITMMDFANKRLGKYRYVLCVCGEREGGRWWDKCACTMVWPCSMEWQVFAFCSLPATISHSDDESITSLTEFTVQKHSVRHPVSHTSLCMCIYIHIYLTCLYAYAQNCHTTPISNSLLWFP